MNIWSQFTTHSLLLYIPNKTNTQIPLCFHAWLAIHRFDRVGRKALSPSSTDQIYLRLSRYSNNQNVRLTFQLTNDNMKERVLIMHSCLHIVILCVLEFNRDDLTSRDYKRHTRFAHVRFYRQITYHNIHGTSRLFFTEANRVSAFSDDTTRTGDAR